MKQGFIKYIDVFFKKMVEVYGFQKQAELDEGQSYIVEYSSDDFTIKIEKYFREFYTTVYKVKKPDSEMNLFNLLEYLKQGDTEIPKSEYFQKEESIDECYRKQIAHISYVIYDNYYGVKDFFREDGYDLSMTKFEEYWKNKHPEFYKNAY